MKPTSASATPNERIMNGRNGNTYMYPAASDISTQHITAIFICHDRVSAGYQHAAYHRHFYLHQSRQCQEIPPDVASCSVASHLRCYPGVDAGQLHKSIPRISGGIHAKSGYSRTWSTNYVLHVLDCFLRLLCVQSRVGLHTSARDSLHSPLFWTAATQVEFTSPERVEQGHYTERDCCTL